MNLWIEDFIKINKYSRPNKKLVAVRGIVMHYTANPGASAENHIKYFGETMIQQNDEFIKQGKRNKLRYASAHIFVDKDSARLAIPFNEVAYHANESACRIPKLKASTPDYVGGNANLTTIGIEMCIEKDGTLHPETVKRAAAIVAELCKKFRLNPLTDIYRHYDVTHKNCPAPWVANPTAFINFKNEVNKLIVETPEIKAKPTTPKKPEAKSVTKSQPKPAVEGKAIVPYPGKLIKKGDKGKDVERIQRAVGVTPDGIFGRVTEQAVKDYQKRHGLTPDGVVGPATWNTMF
jgi:N-acetylmuramoyl-L-alanine amidase